MRHWMWKCWHATITCGFENWSFRTGFASYFETQSDQAYTSRRRMDFQCALFHRLFFTKHCLQAHIQRHLQEDHLQCNKCKFRTHLRNNIRKLVREVHKEGELKYPVCVVIHGKYNGTSISKLTQYSARQYFSASVTVCSSVTITGYLRHLCMNACQEAQVIIWQSITVKEF